MSFDVPPQEVLTRDSVTVSVDAVVYYRVSNATISVANVENAHQSTRSLAQTTLRNVLGTKNLSEILTEREQISFSMQQILDDATELWYVLICSLFSLWPALFDSLIDLHVRVSMLWPSWFLLSSARGIEVNGEIDEKYLIYKQFYLFLKFTENLNKKVKNSKFLVEVVQRFKIKGTEENWLQTK